MSESVQQPTTTETIAPWIMGAAGSIAAMIGVGSTTVGDVGAAVPVSTAGIAALLAAGWKFYQNQCKAAVAPAPGDHLRNAIGGAVQAAIDADKMPLAKSLLDLMPVVVPVVKPVEGAK